MFGQTRRRLGVLAGTTGLTLALGVGASTGLVPKLANSESASSDQAATGTVAGGGSSSTPEPVLPPTTLVAAPSPPPPPSVAPRALPPTTRAAPRPSAAAATVVPAAPATPPAPVAPALPALVARTVPSAAQVSKVIADIRSLVGGPLLFFPPTPAQVADAGNQVCTAFDQGQTFAQVKATGLSMVPASIIVPPAAADYAVRQAVALYCPGHASRLV